MKTSTTSGLIAAALCACLPLASRGQAAASGAAPDRTPIDPNVTLRSFTVADGFEVNLFASEPNVLKPIAMNFDERGRLWVAGSETYPQLKPGEVPADKVFVLEDSDGDGKADKSTVFAEGLFIPTGIVPGDGGAYVANSTELIHLKDTDGDGKADQRRVVLAGFGTEDTHHIIHTFRWGPDGRMYFEQAIYIHSQVETPHGVKKLDAGGVWRYRTDSQELDVFFTGLVNGWGYVWDNWGRTFATDGAGGEGINYVIPGCNFTATPGYTPGASRVLKGLNPGSPKYCGLEVLTGRHLPDDHQGDLMTADFRANRVVRYKLTETGAGFDAKLMPDFIRSTDKAFRPVDIKMGPDGAIYIADWSNPIINHGEVDFRDPRRDKVHGRIWRVTAKGRKTVDRPNLVGAPVEELLGHLLAPEEYTRQRAKNVLRERGAKEVAPALGKWVKTLKRLKDADPEHAKVEALWAYQGIDTVEPKLLAEVLASPNPQARAAAARVAGAWARKLDDPLALLTPLVTDDHPRVRLEAVRALAHVPTPEAVTVAMRAMDKGVDPFLDYAMYKTAVDLQDAWLPAFKAGKLTAWADPKHLSLALQAVKSPDALKGIVQQLKSGPMPAGNRRDLYELIGSIGGPEDVAVLLEQAKGDALDAGTRAAALRAAERAVRQRKVAVPNVDASAVAAWLGGKDEEVAAAAARLAGAMKLAAAKDALQQLVTTDRTPAGVGVAAAEALAALPGGPAALAQLAGTPGAGGATAQQAYAIAGLASADVKRAAGLAAAALQALPAGPTAGERAGILIGPFLKKAGGADALGAALQGKALNADVAKLSLRYVQGIGQDQPALVDALRKHAGVTDTAKLLTPDELKALVADVAAKGDAARGEAVYRSAAAQCATCHAVAGAGGQLGPDLRAIGAASPVDYLVESILVPGKAIKDGFDSVIVTTKDGDVVQGVKVREDGKELVLRDNLRDEITIATDNIKGRKAGGSLMPAGLADGLTRAELVDLVRFLSELGKPGPYAASDDRVVRRWQALDPVPAGLAADANATPPAADSGWWPAYSLTSGVLPLAEAPGAAKGVAYVRCKVDVTEPGPVRLAVNSPKGLTLWANDRRAELTAPEVILDLPRGVHTLTFRVDPAARGAEGLRLEVTDAPGSAGRARPVVGR